MNKTYFCMVQHRMGKQLTSVEATDAATAKRRLEAMGYKVLTYPTLDD